MNVVTNTWRQLVRRRLWPVALLLVAALGAIPVLLSREPAPVPAPADPAGMSADPGDTLAEPVVAKVSAEDRDRRRRVLGARKDPFEPAPVPKAKKPKAQAAGTVGGEPQADGPTGGVVPPPIAPSYGGGVTPPTLSVPTGSPAAGPKRRAHPAGSVIVRFGDAAGSLGRKLVRKLGPLPDDETPLLVYVGLTKDRKKAIFMIDDALTPDGDGVCKPHPSSCETVRLAKGETEFFDVTDPDTGEVTAQLQLDLVAINRAGAQS